MSKEIFLSRTEIGILFRAPKIFIKNDNTLHYSENVKNNSNFFFVKIIFLFKKKYGKVRINTGMKIFFIK